MPALANPTEAVSLEADLSTMPQGGDDLERLSDMIAADEAADYGGAPDAPPRDASGKFVSAEDSAARAGTQAEGQEGQADDGASGQPQDSASSGTPATTPGQEQQQQQNGEAAPQSRYQKAREREARAWKAINEEKLAIESERAALAAERAQLAQATPAGQARQAPQAIRDEGGYTAQDYAKAVAEFERRGDFELADEARAAAQELQEKAAQASSPEDAARFAAWNKAKADFPQILDPNDPSRAELLAFIKEHPAVLQYPQGPYLAAALVTSRSAASKVPELAKEAARVPELLKQVEGLTAKVKELTALTAVTSAGSPPDRSTRAGKDWSQMTSAEMESQLDREIAEARG